MIYELRTYTTKPGQAAAAANLSGTLGQDIRASNYGKLEGYWMTEIGPLNQVLHLWSYSDLNERARLRAELSQNERWVNEYLPKSREIVIRQDVRLMHCALGPTKPETEGNVYEYRHYRVRPGGAKQWINNFMDIMPVREKYSKNAAVFYTEAGNPNEVSHLWAYPDLNARAEARSACAQDPDWQAFLAKGKGLVEEMNSMILLPASHSPLK